MTDDVVIVPSSDKAMQKKTRGKTAKYPWYRLHIGQSFAVKPADMNFKNLVNYAYRMGKKAGRTFSCVDHGDSYEVACTGFKDVAKKQQKEVNVSDKPVSWDKVKPVDK